MSRTIARTPEQERARYGWITVSETAKRIGGGKPVSPTHVVRLIEAKQLRARDVSMPGSKRREWRVDPSSVEKFLDDRTLATDDAA